MGSGLGRRTRFSTKRHVAPFFLVSFGYILGPKEALDGLGLPSLNYRNLRKNKARFLLKPLKWCPFFKLVPVSVPYFANYTYKIIANQALSRQISIPVKELILFRKAILKLYFQLANNEN